jgi:prevent-host-death family protein
MRRIPISRFKADCFRLLEQVRKTKNPICITRFGKPVAEILPPLPSKQKGDWLGSMKGTFEIVGDIVSPVIDMNNIEALRD